MTIILAIISVSSGFITFLNHFNKPELYYKTQKEYRKKYRSRIVADLLAFFVVYTTKLVSAAVAIISAVAIVLILFLMPSIDEPITSISADSEISSEISPPLSGPATNQTNLENLTPLREEPRDAFFFHEWKRLYPIKINDIEYDHSIGISLPAEVCKDLKKNHDSEREDYKAYIEYSLAYQYETLSFDYGIDDNSFIDDGLYPPQCHFWIVVQSCDSENELSEDENVLFETEPLNYRRSLHSSGDIDVAGAEAIRITVYWEFDVIPAKPLAFNVDIINPILYTAEN